LATQNPIEQEGTYHLPEAQLDRFLLHVWVDYPNREEELAILDLDSNRQQHELAPPEQVINQQDVFAARDSVAQVFIDPKLLGYIADLVMASREPGAYDSDLKRWCRYGASPRASIALARCARAKAWLEGSAYVGPEHIQSVAHDVLRHRILLTFEAEADGVTTDEFVGHLLRVVAVP
ncbi:MAG: MoxR family ATPase, partial [Pseudomonadota bacterium]